jgi:methylase of polypeptide subunit release factors
MASKLKNFDIEKLTGKVYTPPEIVDLILDEVGFKSTNSEFGTIVDPACGDGAFLNAVVNRILSSSLSDAEKSNCLENVYGWDIDQDAIDLCKGNLNKIVQSHGLNPISWNIRIADALDSEFVEINSGKFDYVVANPPYVRIQHLDLETRKYLVEKYDYCKSGSTDIYFAFIELGEKLLNKNGKAGYITPNSFLGSEAGIPLRSSWATSKRLTKLLNFGHHQIFTNASTYNAVFFFDLHQHSEFSYERWSYPLEIEAQKSIQYENLKTYSTWNFDYEFAGSPSKLKLKDICSIHVGIQTLADKVFFLHPLATEDGFVTFRSRVNGKEYKIEENLLKPAMKVSRISSISASKLMEERILWPYPEKLGQSTAAISEEKMSQDYPLAYEYLCDHRDLLDNRDNGAPNPGGWFAFARQQGLKSQFQPKIVFPPMVEKPVFVALNDPNVVVYSGYFILSDQSPTAIMAILNSKEMDSWVTATGRDLRGGWKSMSKKILEDFPIPDYLATELVVDSLF